MQLPDELGCAEQSDDQGGMQELWEIVSKAELNALIEAANGYLDGDYTTESFRKPCRQRSPPHAGSVSMKMRQPLR